MSAQERPDEPPLSFRISSTLTIGIVGSLARTFLYALSKTETHGLDRVLETLDNRRDPWSRERGLITISNHLCVLDDPIIWGVLPFRYHFNPNNHRWSLGSHDICFKNRFSSAFFTYGNTLPVHRLAHSKYGGPFQPTMTQAIRLLSSPHDSSTPPPPTPTPEDSMLASLPPSDPFSASELTYTTNGLDTFPAPSAYPSRRFSWIHVFPEGMIHQHPQKAMRYFKWGIARLILESEPCPDVLPMWIDGLQDVMSEKRSWPRPVPRPGKRVEVTFGELVDREVVLEPLRERWRVLKDESRARRMGLLKPGAELPNERLGELEDEELRYGPEAQKLRIEVTLAVRDEVLKVRRSRGLPDEDPKPGLAETYRKEGGKGGPREGEMEDRSILKDT